MFTIVIDTPDRLRQFSHGLSDVLGVKATRITQAIASHYKFTHVSAMQAALSSNSPVSTANVAPAGASLIALREWLADSVDGGTDLVLSDDDDVSIEQALVELDAVMTHPGVTPTPATGNLDVAGVQMELDAFTHNIETEVLKATELRDLNAATMEHIDDADAEVIACAEALTSEKELAKALALLRANGLVAVATGLMILFEDVERRHCLRASKGF